MAKLNHFSFHILKNLHTHPLINMWATMGMVYKFIFYYFYITLQTFVTFAVPNQPKPANSINITDQCATIYCILHMWKIVYE